MKELLFYAVNREYIKYLSMYDEHVSYNKDDIGHSRPYLGIVLEIKCYRYFVPLYSYKEHYEKYKNNPSFFFIYDRKRRPLAIIKFSAMIPIPMKMNVMNEIKLVFRPEFLNRIDEIMVFHTLNKEEIRKIVLLLLKSLEKRCEEQMDIHLNVTNSAVDYIAEAGFDAKYGARPLRRAIQSKIEDRLANELLEGKIKRGDIVQVQYRNKEIRFIVK